MSTQKTRNMVLTAMLAAIAYIATALGRFPIVLFLKFDPKDAVIAICGFLLGPLPAVTVSAVVSLVEMFTLSETGIIGFVMNVVSTCAFVLPAALLYARKRTLKNAVVGLIVGTVVACVVMMLWNVLLTPIYMGYPRKAVVDLLLPAFLPFNLIKGSLNAGITLLIYKPLSQALRRAHLMPGQPEAQGSAFGTVTLASLLVIAASVVAFLILSGKLFG